VGFSQESMTPAEWDISEHIHKDRAKKNVIAIEVYQWSDGSYLEDQDMFRFSGIFREIYLYTKPNIHIHDAYLTCKFDEFYQDAEYGQITKFIYQRS